MKINKKLNYSRIVALSSYLFLSTLAIFISTRVGTCLASVVDVNNSSELEIAIGDNSISTINIEADSITLDRKLPLISRNLSISGEKNGSILDGNNKTYGILTFIKNALNITINNINFENGNSNNKTNVFDYDKMVGGAIYIEVGTTIALSNTNFSNNKADFYGGAICSDGSIKNKNTLVFNGKTTFAGNGVTTDGGGAIYAGYSDLIFNGDAEFKNNSSSYYAGAIFLDSHYSNYSIGSSITFEGAASFSGNVSKEEGGAIYSQVTDYEIKSILKFNGKTTFTKNESTDGSGGAIHTRYSNLIFAGEAEFANNKSKKNGGAICSKGHKKNKNTLKFGRKTIFAGNESTDDGGGAVYLEYSDLTFGGEVKFENNVGKNAGGAIYAEDSNLIFAGEAEFTNNKSKKNGGAIYAWYSGLGFGKDVKFENNSSSANGGAISMNNNSQENAANATFSGLAIFRDNSSARGGAIYLGGNISMMFNSGLKLIDNSTGEEKSGAIHMEGEGNDQKVKVTIVQKDPRNPTIFRGNKSNAGQGQNAFYLQKHADLNFSLESGNINLYDSIVGDKTENSNIVTLEGSGGQFKLREKGSIDNVNLINRGAIINLEESQAIARPLNFRNSGRIIFEIFPENNSCSGIQARDINLEEGTTLEIVAARGTYKAGSSYDLLVSENTIRKSGNINVTLPQKFTKGLRARTGLVDSKFYRLFIEADDENNTY
ncbi:MAG: hypothetical protein LBP39_00335 [Rickettsiales bacterium]|nr:hypothetical protein [Rickettsiales bacterium]